MTDQEEIRKLLWEIKGDLSKALQRTETHSGQINILFEESKIHATEIAKTKGQASLAGGIFAAVGTAVGLAIDHFWKN